MSARTLSLLSERATGGASTGPAAPTKVSTDPWHVLEALVARAILRDLRRLGEVLRNPCTDHRRSALRRHLHVLVGELDPCLPHTETLRRAGDAWQAVAGRATGQEGSQEAVRTAVGDLEQLLAPLPGELHGAVQHVDDLGRSTGTKPGQSSLSVRRIRWLLDGVEQPELSTAENLLTNSRWRAAKLLGRRAERRRHALLWG